MMTQEEMEVFVLNLETNLRVLAVSQQQTKFDFESLLALQVSRLDVIEGNEEITIGSIADLEVSAEILRQEVVNQKSRLTATRERLREVENFEGRIKKSLEDHSSYKLSRRLLNRSKHNRPRND